MECKRVLFDVRNIFVILILLFMGWFSFYRSINQETDVIVVPDEENEITYSQKYSDYLTETVHKAEIFAERSESEIKKQKFKRTAKDFKKLEQVSIAQTNDETLTNIYEYGGGSYVLIFVGIFLSALFLRERSVGMWSFVYTTKRGRMSLAVRRLLILITVMMTVTLLYYAGIFAIAINKTGGLDYSISIQSYEIFGQFVKILNVEEFIVYFLLLKILFSVTVGVLCYAVMISAENKVIGILTIIVVFAVEILLHMFIEPNSRLEILRNINMIYFVDIGELLKEYTLFSIFGVVIEKRTLIISISIIVLLFSAVYTVICNSYKKPFVSRSIYEILIEGSSIGDFFAEFPAIVTEWRKQFIWNGGFAVFLVVVVAAASQFNLADSPYKSSVTHIKRLYQDCEGKSLDETEEYIKQLETELLYLDSDTYEYKLYMQDLRTLKDRYEYAVFMQKNGYDVEVADYTGYRVYYNIEVGIYYKIFSGILLTAMILMFSALWVCEKNFHTYYYIRTTRYGRKKLYRDKMIYTVICTAAMYLILMGSRIYVHLHNYGFGSLNKCVQNIEVLSYVKTNCTIGQYLIVTEFARFGLFILIALIIGFMSRHILIRQQE